MPTLGSSRLRANLLILCTAAIWGFAFSFQRVASEHMGAFAFNGLRFALGALSLLPVIAWMDSRAGRTRAQRRVLTAAALRPGVLAGVVLWAAAGLQQAGLTDSTAGEAAFISGLYMVIVPLLGLGLGIRVRWNVWCGVGLAVIGLYVLSVRERLTVAPADLLLMASALFLAVHILVIDRYAPRQDALRLSCVQFIACSGASVVTSLLCESGGFAGTGAVLVPLLYAGCVSVAVAYTLQVFAQRHVRPTDAALIFSTEAVFAVIGGALFLAENLGPRGYAGCALMLAGIVVAQLSPQSSEVLEPGERSPV